MPELPEVEAYVRRFRRGALRRRVARVDLLDPRLLREGTGADLRRAFEGRPFDRVARRGKWLLARAAGTPEAWLGLHFGMTGDLRVERGDAEPRYARLVLRFADRGRLVFTDQRRFGEIALATTFDGFVRERELGADALGLDAARLGELAATRPGPVKGLLLDQSALAGVGNLYADEALWQARIDPKRPARSLGAREIARLAGAVRRILSTAVARRADFGRYPRGWLLHGREGGAQCPRCGAPLRSGTVAGRTTVWCGREQG